MNTFKTVILILLIHNNIMAQDITTVKINELATSAINSADYFVKADVNGIAYKNTLSALANFIGSVGASGYKGALAIADTPTEDGFYFASESGTYTNAGGLVVDLANGINIISVTEGQTVFELVVIPVSVTATSVVNYQDTTSPINSLSAGRSSISTAVNQGSYLYFNGVNAKMQLDKDYVLSSDGDYVEFRFDLLDYTSNARYGIFGKLTAGSEQDIGLNVTGTETKVYTLKVRGGNATWTDFVLKESYYSRNRYRIEIANSATELNLYENGTLTDTQPFTGGQLIIRDIAAAYSTQFTKMNLHHFKIHSTSDGDVSSLSDAISLSSFQNLKPIQPEVKYAGCYVTYQLTASITGNERFSVYTRIGQTNKYIRFEIDHELDMSDLIYSDQWRIRKAFAYEFDGETMVSLGVECLQGGESESVYKRIGKDDYSGGYHGDEIATSIAFFVDGVKLPDSYLNADFSLLPCEKFSYNQVSTVHTAPTGGVPAPGHPVEAIRTKRTSFYDGCYDTDISYTWQMDISDFEEFFSSLSSISVGYANYGENSKLDLYRFTESGDRVLLDIGGDWMRQYHLAAKRSVEIESWASINNDVSASKVWDVAAYHKFYRDLKEGNVLDAEIGDVWKMKTKVSFKLLP